MPEQKKDPSIITWGMIGCGNVTEIKSGPAFQKADHSRLLAVMRRDAAKAADYAARHHVPKYYSDAIELINDEEIDAVYIATPPKFHEAYTIAALQKGKYVSPDIRSAIYSIIATWGGTKEYNALIKKYKEKK